MRYGLLAVVLIGAATLGGCTEGVLDPKGPIAAAERQILFNSLGIMLAIVIPVILATLGVAWWFRASNHARALSARLRLFRPDRDGGLVDPGDDVLLVGGVAWIGSHDLDPRKPIASTAKPLEVQVVSLDWKWLFIYPDQGIASVNQLTIPVGTPVSFELTSSGVMNSFFVPQLGSQIYTMAGMATRLQSAGRPPGNLSRAVGAVQRRWLFRHALRRRRRADRGVCAVGGRNAAAPVRRSTRKLTPIWPSRARRSRPSPIAPSPPGCSTASVMLRNAARRSARAARDPASHEGRTMNLLGKLELERDSLRPADRHGRVGVDGRWRSSSFSAGSRSRATGRICGASGSRPSITSASASCTSCWRWSCCCAASPSHHDARAAGHRCRRRAGISAAGALRPDLLGARHDHDLLHGDAVRDRPDEFRRAAAARRARRGVSDAELGELLADRLRRAADQYLAGRSASSPDRLARLSAAVASCNISPGVGVDYYLWALQISGVGTLLTGINFVTTILKTRAPGMSYMRMPVFCWTALASNLLIVAAFPILTATFAMLLLDRYLGFHFFTIDGRRQPDDVRQPDLGLGPPGGLHPGPAGVRRVLRGRRDILRQAAVRLPLHGRGDHGDLRAVLHGLAAPLLHHGRRRRRQRLLRRHDHDHRRADRREDLQLAVHDVRRPHPLHRADATGRSASW